MRTLSLCLFLFIFPSFSMGSPRIAVERDVPDSELKVVPQNYLRGTTEADLSSFILRNNSMSISLYRQADGEGLSYRKMRGIISRVPENKKLMRQERVWRISSQSLAAASLASLCAAVISYNEGSAGSPKDGLIGAFTFGVFSFSSRAVANNKLQRGVDNYNYNVAKRL